MVNKGVRETFNHNKRRYAILFEEVLVKLRQLVKHLVPGAREYLRNGIHFFDLNGKTICFYNEYTGGGQLVFNRRGGPSVFSDAVYDFTDGQGIDWVSVLRDLQLFTGALQEKAVV